MWDPGQYQRFAGERGRPFFDLLTRVRASDPGYVVDLGCGPGNLTAALAERWPGADVVGVDNSPEMIGAARAEAGPRLSFALGDLREWRPARPVDVLVPITDRTVDWRVVLAGTLRSAEVSKDDGSLFDMDKKH